MDFRRGKEEIAKANEAAKAGGDREFRPFLQTFFWKDDGDNRYLLILNPAEEIPLIHAHPKVWPGDGRPPRAVMARTERKIGEASDPISDQWDYAAQDLNAAVAVELEPEFEVVRGRPRPVAFEVKTRTYERRIRDDSGELTDEREEITAPEVGLILQSPNNFFKHVSNKDTTVGPIQEIPICVTRVGKDQNTDYEIDCFEHEEVDLTPLIDFVDGISYLNDEMDDLIEKIAEMSTHEAAVHIGGVLLDKRLNELADIDYYNEVLEGITEPARYGKRRKNKAETKKPERQQRRSQVRARREEGEATEGEDKPQQRQQSLRQRTSRSGGREEATNKESPVRERLKELREKSEASQASRS